MIILTYHKIKNVANFERQIRYLVRKKYNLLSLSDFLLKCDAGTSTPKDILVTFDDGDFSLFENAMPVLLRLGCPSVVFVITGLIGTKQPFWWDEIESYTKDGKQVKNAKLLSNAERLLFLGELRNKCVKPGLQYRQLTIAELRTMEDNNMVIANHSHTHPMFDKLSKSEMIEELQLSSAFLKGNGFSAHNVFAYPNGNFTELSESVLRDLGFRLAFLFDHKVQGKIRNPLRISRLSVNDNTPIWKFKLILRGWHSVVLPLIKTINKARL